MEAHDNQSPFGERLRRLRVAAGLSQEALAERAGLSAQAIGALETGKRRRPYPPSRPGSITFQWEVWWEVWSV